VVAGGGVGIKNRLKVNVDRCATNVNQSIELVVLAAHSFGPCTCFLQYRQRKAVSKSDQQRYRVLGQFRGDQQGAEQPCCSRMLRCCSIGLGQCCTAGCRRVCQRVWTFGHGWRGWHDEGGEGEDREQDGRRWCRRGWLRQWWQRRRKWRKQQ